MQEDGLCMMIKDLLLEYDVSLKSIYETEMFYGEPVLQRLIKQTKEVVEEIDEILKDYDYEDAEIGENLEVDYEEA